MMSYLNVVFSILASPVSIMSVIYDGIVEIFSDRIVLAIVSFIFGMAVLLTIEIFFVMMQLRDNVQPPPSAPRSVIRLPEVLRNRLNMQSLTAKEDCVWLNFLTHFLFTELRDSIALKRFITKKIQKEFEEVLTSRTGVFMDELFLRDFNLGDKFPIFMGVSVDKCDVKDDIIEALDIRTRIIYDGGFQICIDAALPFGRTAYISVKLLKLKGFLRLRFTSKPFSYWCFSFYEEPELELDVSAQLDGRPVAKLKNVISHQIRKILRKKHMLPMYKIRYKPFFQPVAEFLPSMPENLQISGVPIASGVLEVTLTSASKLPATNKGAQLYCTLSADSLPWKQMMAQARLKNPILTRELIKNQTDPSIGLILKDAWVSDRLHPVVLVEQVLVGSPAHLGNVKQGDIMITINGNKVTSAKQATKLLKSSKDKLSIQVESSIEMNEEGSTQRSSHSSQSQPAVLDSEKRIDGKEDDGMEDKDDPASAPILSDKRDFHKWNSKKTRLKPSSSNPTWDELFIFVVKPTDAYLNVCVWSHGGDGSSQSDTTGTLSQDTLLGHVNLNLDDIYLHCLLTLEGKLYDKVKLKHGHHQTEEELAKEWASHKGWNPELMYGDLSLTFRFKPSLLTEGQRRNLSNTNSLKMEDLLVKFREDKKRGTDPMTKSPKRPTNTNEDLVHDSTNYTQGHHQFDSTSFATASFCDYCGKKIWMKEAFKCRTCGMKCHKKCLVKCLVNTFCTEEGVRKRTAVDEEWEPLTVSNRSKTGTATSDYIVEGSDSFTFTITIVLLLAPVIILIVTFLIQGNVHDGNNSDRETFKFSVVESTDTTLQSDETRSPSRFRNLKDRTERMKDNVVKSICKAKPPTNLTDNMILEAKEVGAQLFSDMEPGQRKEKLDEMVTHLDEQLKLEMKHKEDLEQELESFQASDITSNVWKKKIDPKTIENKIHKSADKLNAMRLLMVQYCTALQVCMKETEGMTDLEKAEAENNRASSSTGNAPHGSRVSYMGGIVKRASSSVKEKMSSIRKDFGKKGSPKSVAAASSHKSMSSQEEARNNNRIITSFLGGLTSKSGKNQGRSDELSKEFTLKNLDISDDEDEGVDKKLIKIPEPSHTRSRSLVDESLFRCSEDDSLPHLGSLPSKLSLPKIEIGNASLIDTENSEDNDDVINGSETINTFAQPVASRLARSSSDSRLEINKMVSLNPDDILRHHGNSLPKVLVSEDDNSDSDDYFILGSSDDDDISDFSEEERHHGHSKNSPQCSIEADGNLQPTVTPEDVMRGTMKYSKSYDRDVPRDKKNSKADDDEPLDENIEHNDPISLEGDSQSYIV